LGEGAIEGAGDAVLAHAERGLWFVRGDSISPSF
jgi:hypothetical protein